MGAAPNARDNQLPSRKEALMLSSSRPWLLDRAFDRRSELFSEQWFGNVVEKSHLSTIFEINVGVVSVDGDGPNRLNCAQFLHQVPSGAIGQANVVAQLGE